MPNAKVVLVDATKLYQLARFTCKSERKNTQDASITIEDVFMIAQQKGWRLVTTEVNLRRAWESFRRKELKGMDEEKAEELRNLFITRVELLVDVFGEEVYRKILPKAVEILRDTDREYEDSHLLSLGILYKHQGFDVIIWSSDKDFDRNGVKSLGITVVSKLI